MAGSEECWLVFVLVRTFVFAALGVFVIFAVLGLRRRSKMLLGNEGVGSAHASITGKEMTRSTGGDSKGHTYALDYRFIAECVDGTRFQATVHTSVPPEVWTKVEVGQTVAVKYFRDDPEVQMVQDFAQQNSTNTKHLLASFCCGGFPLGFALLSLHSLVPCLAVTSTAIGAFVSVVTALAIRALLARKELLNNRGLCCANCSGVTLEPIESEVQLPGPKNTLIDSVLLQKMPDLWQWFWVRRKCAWSDSIHIGLNYL
mmetsp:Transcript_94987/g.268301  ORF Transcript_94987/g.268301 Transcript_94987/m.268301 type:complete len:258 (+) Transcript_94987:54-827(+)